MAKSTTTITIDTDLLERARLNNINLSKEINDYLKRIFSLPTISMPNEKDEIDKLLKEKQIKMLEDLKEIENLKTKKQSMTEQKEKERLESLRWRKVPVK